MRGICRLVHKNQMRVAADFSRQFAQLEVAPDIAIHQDEGIAAKQGQCVEHAAAGFQRHRAFVEIVDFQVPAASIAKGLREPAGQVGNVDHHLDYADCGQLLQVPLDEVLAADLEQWLGYLVGERAHAFASPRGKDHGAGRAHPASNSRFWRMSRSPTTLRSRSQKSASCG
jgi:hypothetical protein